MSVKTVVIRAGNNSDEGVPCSPSVIYWLTAEGTRVLDSKIRGYRNQDRKKNRECEVVRKNDIITMLVKAKGCCLYCKKVVLMRLYPPRSKKQWSLDRKDNTRGHTADNVVIACLGCNLRRRSRDYGCFLRGERMSWKKTGN